MEVRTYRGRLYCVCETLRIDRQWFVRTTFRLHTCFANAHDWYRRKNTAEASYARRAMANLLLNILDARMHISKSNMHSKMRCGAMPQNE